MTHAEGVSLLRGETPVAHYRREFMFYQKWYIYCFSNEEVEAPSFRKDTIADAPSFRKGTVADARVSPEAATSASGGGGVSSLAPWAFEEEDAAMLKLRVRFCQDTLISTQMTVRTNHAWDRATTAFLRPLRPLAPSLRHPRSLSLDRQPGPPDLY